MTVLGPNDPRALRSTGRTWKDRNGKDQPIMVDGFGVEYEVYRPGKHRSVEALINDLLDHMEGDK